MTETYVVTPHQNRLGDTVQMRGHNVCFNAEIGKIIPKSLKIPVTPSALEVQKEQFDLGRSVCR